MVRSPNLFRRLLRGPLATCAAQPCSCAARAPAPLPALLAPQLPDSAQQPASRHAAQAAGCAKPRVALFATNFLPPSQTFIYDELGHHRRYSVEVFAHNRQNREAFPYPAVNALSEGRSLRDRSEWLLYGLTTFSPRYWARLRTGSYALLHAHFGPGSIYALTYKRAARAPLVVTFHGYDVPLLLSSRRYHPQFWRYWLRARAMLRQVDRFLGASCELCQLLIQLGAPPERVHLWQLGVEIPPLARPPQRSGNRALMIGRFVEKKGFADGLRALAEVSRQGIDCTLDVIGDGELRPQLEALVRELRLEGRVNLLGVRSHDEVQARLAAADVLLAPSVVAANGDRESGLLVAKEAAARCVPVIGTRHGGIPEIIDDGETGFLVPERDHRALAARLALLLGDPQLRWRLGQAGRRKMEREYEIGRRVQVLEEHYDALIAAGARR